MRFTVAVITVFANRGINTEQSASPIVVES